MPAELIILTVLISIYILLQYLEYKFRRNSNVRKMKKMIKGIEFIINDTIISKKPYVKMKVLEKDAETRYIKFGVEIGREGVIDALLGNSPLDEIKTKINYFVDTTIELDVPYKIDVILIES